LETWEPSQHSLVDTGKPRKTCVEVKTCVRVKVVTTCDTPLPYHSGNSNSHFHGSLTSKPNNWTFEPINMDKENEDCSCFERNND